MSQFNPWIFKKGAPHPSSRFSFLRFDLGINEEKRMGEKKGSLLPYAKVNNTLSRGVVWRGKRRGGRWKRVKGTARSWPRGWGKAGGEVCALFYRAQSDTRALNWQKRCIKLAEGGLDFVYSPCSRIGGRGSPINQRRECFGGWCREERNKIETRYDKIWATLVLRSVLHPLD